MLLARVGCSILFLAIGGILAAIAFRAISNGFVKPFQMGRWSEPDEVCRQDAPLPFWGWVFAYFGLSAAAIVLSILGLMGNIKLR